MHYCYLNHKIIPASEALVPVSDRGFRFGDGVFETIRVHAGVAYRFEWHMARLAEGLQAIHIAADIGTLQKECSELLIKNACKEGLLRIQITRGTSGSGYLPAESAPTCLIETLPFTPTPNEPAALYLSTYRRIPATCLPVSSKLAQGMNSTLARMEAQENGCFEALQLNTQGIIAEGSSSNIFWRKNTTLYTPALDCGVLNGAMRAVILSLYPDTIHEIHADSDVLAGADAVCVVNSAWLALPVSTLSPKGYSWESKALAEELNTIILKDIESYTASHAKLW